MSPFLQFFLSSGVPLETVGYLLLLPVVVTLVVFFRQVIGLKGFGMYTPTLITFSFLITGLKYGIALYIGVIAAGLATRSVLKNIRLLYLPRVALSLTFISFFVLLVLVVGGMIQRTGFAAVSLAPLIIMIVLTEKLIAVQMEKGTKTALIIAVQTLIISLIGVYLSLLLLGDGEKGVIFRYPWIILFTLPLNILLGKWTGLRVSEWYRFRSLLR